MLASDQAKLPAFITYMYDDKVIEKDSIFFSNYFSKAMEKTEAIKYSKFVKTIVHRCWLIKPFFLEVMRLQKKHCNQLITFPLNDCWMNYISWHYVHYNMNKVISDRFSFYSFQLLALWIFMKIVALRQCFVSLDQWWWDVTHAQMPAHATLPLHF